MTETPYTSRRFHQYRGPDSSEDYNARNEEIYKDLVYLYNTNNTVRSDLAKSNSAFYKELLSIARGLDDFETRLQVVEEGYKKVGFYSESQIDNDRFNSTPYAVGSSDRCTYHSYQGQLTLPRLEASSVSKLRFANDDGTYGVPGSLEMNIIPDATSLDDPTATIDTSQPYNAIIARPGRVWDRNVIVSSPAVKGAICALYVKIPNDLSIVNDVNSIILNAFPMKSADIISVEYTTTLNPKLTPQESWTPLNNTARYSGNQEAVGHIPPGAWAGDEILEAGPKAFYFDPEPITAFKITIRQKNYFTEGGKYVYSYGLSKLDVRYEKFLTTGKSIIRFDAPSGDTISSVRQVAPKIWNIPESLVNDVFSIRTIWETGFNSGVYTLTPVPFSQRVWIEVTMNQTPAGGSPSLSGLVITYR